MYENISTIFTCLNSSYFSQFHSILKLFQEDLIYMKAVYVCPGFWFLTHYWVSKDNFLIYTSWLHLARGLWTFLLKNHCWFSVLNVFALRMFFLPNTKEQTICWHWVIQFSHTLNNLHPNTSSRLTSVSETHCLRDTDLRKYSEDEKSIIFKRLHNGNLDFNYFWNN